jgi:radical SAM protein with 4Fe4S-binding SPASM domain
MEARYQFIDGVYLITGAARGAILDTNTGLVYSVNKQACMVCTYQEDDEPFWLTFVSKGIAEQVENPGLHQFPKPVSDNSLKFIWFEIATDDCNERCIHCYADSMPKSYKNGNLGFENSVEKESIPVVTRTMKRMAYDDWLKAIKEANDLGCKCCQFIGGEPLLYRGEKGETVLDLVSFARQVGHSSIEIFTNASLLTPAKIQMIKELGVKVAVSLYSDDPEVYDSITRSAGSYTKTVNALALLKKYEVETRVETIILKANQHTVVSTLAFRNKMGYKGRRPDPLRPIGRGDNPLNQAEKINLIKYGLKLNPNFNASKEIISHNQSRHPCLYGKIAITEFGDVLPCIFTRNHILGNYLDTNSIQPILNPPELLQLWHTTKDNVYVCRDCEYRYVCFDCRPLAEAAAAGYSDLKTSPYPRCTYNPYTGNWGDGVWKVDQAGNAYYDQSLADEIKQVRQSLYG